MEKLNEDIKNKNIDGIYALIGDETFLINRYKKRIIEVMEFDENDINLNFYEGKNTSMQEVEMTLNTLPFARDKRLVIFENTGICNQDKFEDIIKKANNSIIIIIETNVDKRTKGYNLLKKYAKITEFSKGNEELKIAAINFVLKEYNKKMRPDVYRYIIDNSDDDMYSIINNTKKVVVADSNTNIDINIAKKFITPLIKNRIFDMIRAIVKNNAEETIRIYKDLMYLNESPYKIMSLILREFRMLSQVKDSNIPDKELAKYMGIRDFALKNYKTVAQKIDNKFIVKAMDKCVELESDIKLGKVSEKLGLERLIIMLLKR